MTHFPIIPTFNAVLASMAALDTLWLDHKAQQSVERGGDRPSTQTRYPRWKS
jgi:hypothetical protein